MQTMTARERWHRVEQIRSARRATLRWRWVVVGLGGLLALALLANGSLLIGGMLTVLLVARIVMLTRVQRLWKARDAAFTRRFGPGSHGGPVDAPIDGPIDGPIDVA